MTRLRAVCALLAGLALLVSPMPVVAQTPATIASETPAEPAWLQEVGALLERRARAVMEGDEGAFLGTMTGAPEAFRSDRLTWFRRIRSLPLGHYSLSLGQGEYGELTRAADRSRHTGEVHVVQVKERIGLQGYDVDPVAEDVFLTVVKGTGGWSVVADDDVEDLALQSARNLWDFGPIDHLSEDGIMVVFHPGERAAASRILAVTRQARDAVKRQWPNRWREDRIVVMIPDTDSELARILQTTFDLSTFVAFAASSVERAAGWSLTGPRIYLHWPNFRGYGTSFQRGIMQHELLHLATREMTGPYVTAIMDEGVAQYYGEAAYDPTTPQLRTMVRDNRFANQLNEDFVFTAGTPDEIYASYEQANHFIAYVGDRFGRPAGARLYRDLGAANPISPGTWRYHLDRACRSALGVSFTALERDWARNLVRELS